MTIYQLRSKIRSMAKTLNSRLTRLEKEGLPASTQYRIEQAKDMETGYITETGKISGAVSGMTEYELKTKMHWLAGMLESTETVTQARENVKKKMAEWKVDRETAIQRIKQGRVFYQVLQYGGASGVFDSERVHIAIEEFDRTPNYSELVDKVFMDFGYSMQHERAARKELLKWMRDKNVVPPGVAAEYNPETGQIDYYQFRGGTKYFLEE